MARSKDYLTIYGVGNLRSTTCLGPKRILSRNPQSIRTATVDLASNLSLSDKKELTACTQVRGPNGVCGRISSKRAGGPLDCIYPVVTTRSKSLAKIQQRPFSSGSRLLVWVQKKRG